MDSEIGGNSGLPNDSAVNVVFRDCVTTQA